jgi:methyl-accepting chemotaxis protein
LAQSEQVEAEETAAQLESMLQRLDGIAASAQQANQVADTTSNTTRHAQETVSRSVENMTNIRDTVQETGKRLKRLGERSQEISQIIDVINNLSERTTVLALNASMQATAAGDAGRGFSMIAEEIQRLAENSRDSTNQIATLVRNIQQEANTTIATMDNTIAQVVSGSTLAEEAAQQMQATLEATNELVTSVEQIATASAEQVAVSKDLQNRAERILESTQATGKELLSLTGLTRDMAEYGQSLVKSVNVFKLEA